MTRFAGEKVDMSTYMQDSPDYGNLGNQSQTSRSRLKQSGLMNEAQMASAGLKGMSDVMGAKFGADATKAQASAAESAGMWDMIGNIGGGLLGAFGGGGGGFSNETVTGNKLPSFTRRNTSTNMITTY